MTLNNINSKMICLITCLLLYWPKIDRIFVNFSFWLVFNSALGSRNNVIQSFFYYFKRFDSNWSPHQWYLFLKCQKNCLLKYYTYEPYFGVNFGNVQRLKNGHFLHKNIATPYINHNKFLKNNNWIIAAWTLQTLS